MTRLPVNLYGVHLGDIFDLGPGRISFRSSAEGLEHFGIGSRVLSANLPLSDALSNEDAAIAFFGGILPEGRGREHLAKQSGRQKTDLFGMLSYVGRDVPGAIVIGAPAGPGQHQPMLETDVEDKLNRTADYSMGSTGGGGSLPGVQPKIVLSWDGEWMNPTDGATSTHILKPVLLGEEWLAHWEGYCLDLARKVGLLNFESHVSTFGARTALVIQRYDRVQEGGTIKRIHQEDGAQALGLPWDSDAKFERVDPRASNYGIARLLPKVRRLSPDSGDRRKLLAYLTFNTAVGNTDAHAKNFSILRHEDGTAGLAPLYDVTPLALAPNGQQNMAMRVNGKVFQPDITVDHLVNEGVLWGIPEKQARDTVEGALVALREALDCVDPGHTDEVVTKYFRIQTDNLLNGRKAAVSSMPAYMKIF